MFDDDLQKAIDEISNYEFSHDSFKVDFFSEETDIYGKAYLNWRFSGYTMFEQFCTMGDSYLETQYNQLWILLNDERSHRADGWIFPVLFNTVHGIECYLKGFLGQLNIIEQLIDDPLSQNLEFQTRRGHYILDICNEVIAKLKSIYKKTRLIEWKEFIQALEFVKRFIKLLNDRTKDVAVFRYPFDNDFSEVFYNKELDNVTLHLESYFIWFTKVHEILENTTHFISDLNDHYGEMRSIYYDAMQSE